MVFDPSLFEQVPEPEVRQIPLCRLCKDNYANNPAMWLQFGRWEIPLCEECGMTARGFGQMIIMIKDELVSRGVLGGPTRRVQ
jgi:hypothetical protein